MTNERKKEAIKRAECVLVRHLEDLCDEVEQDGGRIKDHMTLDGIKDVVKSMHCIDELMGAEGSVGSDSEPEEDAATETAMTAKARL